MHVENATLRRLSIGREDHGILSASIVLEGASWGQSYGGYALDDRPAEDDDRRRGTALLACALLELFDTFNIDDVDKLKNLPVRVRWVTQYGAIHSIGHFTKDQWFSWEDVVRRLYPKATVEA